jgi:hypothetical protein
MFLNYGMKHRDARSSDFMVTIPVLALFHAPRNLLLLCETIFS